MLRRKAIGILFLPGILLQPPQASAEKRIRLAVVQVGEEGKDRSVPNFAIASDLCQKSGVTCEIVPLPVARAFVELQANRVHFLMSLDHRPSGSNPIKIAKIDSVPIITIARRPIQECQGLNHARAAAIRNVFYAKTLKEKCPGLTFAWVGSYTQAMHMYRSHRVDVVVGVSKNFDGKNPRLKLSPADIVSQVGLESLWLFANEVSQGSAAALKFKAGPS